MNLSKLEEGLILRLNFRLTWNFIGELMFKVTVVHGEKEKPRIICL